MNKSRSSQKKKQKSQDIKILRDIRIPVEPKIPQCQVCEKKKQTFIAPNAKSIIAKIVNQKCTLRSGRKSIKTSFSKNLMFHEMEIFEKEEKEEIQREKERKKEQQRKREIQREKEKSEEIRRLKQGKKEIEIQRSKEEFDPKMNRENIIKLKNENKTVWNPSIWKFGRICGKKIYCRGKHQIKIKIDQLPNPENEENEICLGVIKTENMEKLIKNGEWDGTYYFRTRWDGKENESKKLKKENGKWMDEKYYPEEIYFKKNDIFEIFLDMDQKKSHSN